MSTSKKKKIDEKIKSKIKCSLAYVDPALCRCCGSLTKFRVVNGNYYNLGQLEVYSDMIKNCFGIELSKLDGKLAERLICAPCVNRVRDACNFRLQVHNTEKELLLKPKTISASKIRVKSNTEMKQAKNLGVCDMTIPDGLDDELDLLQLEEYYALGDEMEPRDTNGCSGEDSPVETYENKRPRWNEVQPVKKVKEKPASHTLDNKNYMYNAVSILRYSHACPFKNRFNHILCHYCCQYFLDPALLREHTNQHTYKEFKNTTRNRYIKIDITRIDCKLCPEKIDSLDDFKQHLMTVHRKPYFPQSKDGVIPFKLIQNVNICTLCGEEFQQFKGLVRHMDQHFSNYVCETCGMGFMDEKSLQKHLPAHSGRRYPCDECGSSLKSEYTLQCHMRRIHGRNEAVSDLSDAEPGKEPESPKEPEPALPCQGCELTFKSRRYLAIHVRRVHMNYRQVCQVCGQKFFTRFALNNHMPTHTGERNYKCKECGKTYPRLKTLKEHMRIHTNDRRYRCHICGQAFIQNCSLKGHLKSKHPEYR